MAKISPVSIKYMIFADFEAEGAVEKPDVIGALFGQTEGLLGNDLEMRELQKEGKIGRIEVDLQSQNGKTLGKIQIPSALDKTETTLIAAAIETIERIGPSNAKITIEKIDDVRGNKREYILERAKKLLEKIDENIPKTREISENMKQESRANKITEYGDEKLPAGDISGNEVIVVEGRADVVNLLRNGVNNVIGMNGTILPEGIKKLSFEKEITLFVDGDRGGKLITKNVSDNARIVYVAVAPDGKEVEELAGKEILWALRKRIPIREIMRELRDVRDNNYRREYQPREMPQETREREEIKPEPVAKKAMEFSLENKEKIADMMKEIENSKSIILIDSNMEIIRKVSSRNLFLTLDKFRGKTAAIIADTANSMIIKAAEDAGITNVVARKFTFSGESKANLISL